MNPICNSVKLTTPVCIAKGDSAASRHYVCPEDKDILSAIECNNGPPVGLPNALQLPSTHQGILPLSSRLSTAARTA